MGFAIRSNVPSLTALGNLDKVSNDVTKSLSKLSTGLRIVKAGDDASGLMISERMRAQIGSLQTARLNSEEGISMASTAEGALNEVNGIMQRLRTLTLRATQDITMGAKELGELELEKDKLVDEIDRIAAYVQFNGKVLFDGTLSGAMHVGPNSSTTADEILVTFDQLNSATLTLNAIDLTSSDLALAALGSIDTAIEKVAEIRGTLGVTQNRLEYTVANINVMIENTVASESRIRDVDMASEISNFTRLQILQQSGVSMLGQANAQPQAVLNLLR